MMHFTVPSTLIKVLLQCFKPGYDEGLYKAHLECMYSGLLVHMDDPETDTQLAVQSNRRL